VTTRKVITAAVAAMLLTAPHKVFSQAWSGRPSAHARTIDRSNVSAETPIQIGGDSVGHIAVADFNGDDYGDVAVVLDNSLHVYRGNGEGGFMPFAINYPGAVTDIAAGDFNGDGQPDLMIVGSESDEGSFGLFLLPGQGDGSFGAPRPITGANLPSVDTSCRLATGVFDRTHKQPIDFALWCDTAPAMLYFGVNDGKGTYAVAALVQAVSPDRVIKEISAGDVDGDGLSDVLVVSIALHGAANRSVDLLWNSATGFHPQRNIVSSQGAVVLADYDGDGLADLLAVEDGRLLLKRSAGSSLSPAKILSRESACNVSDVAAGSLQGIQGSLALDIALSEMCPNAQTGVLSPNLAALLNTAGTKVTVSHQNDTSDADTETIAIKVQPLVGTGTPTGKVLVAAPNQPTQSLALSGGSASVVTNKESASKVTALFTASDVFGASFGGIHPMGAGSLNYSAPSTLTWGTNGTFSVNDPCVSIAGPVTLKFADQSDTGAAICTVSLTSTTPNGSCTGGSSLAVGTDSIGIGVVTGTLGACSVSSVPQTSVIKASPTVSASASPSTVTYGVNNITASAHVSCNYACGTVAFQVDGSTWTTASLDGAGNATVGGPSGPSPGSHTVTVSYSGDGNNNGGSGSTTYTIAKDSLGLSLSANHTSVVYGQLTVFTAVVSGGYNATGSVNFDIGSAAGVFGTVPLSGNAAIYGSNNETWGPGTYPIYAVYSGDGLNNGATGAIGSFTVIRQTPAVTIASSGASVPAGSSVTLTANVIDTQPVGFPPSGTVTFFDGSTSIGTATLSSGTVTFTTAALSGGTHSFSFSYAGDGNYNPTSSGSTQVQAGQGPILMDVFASPTSATSGPPVALQGIIDTGGGRSATGSIGFASNGTSIGSVTVSTVSTTNLLPTNGLGGETYQATVTSDSQTAPDGSVTAETVSIPPFSNAEAYVGLNSNVVPASGDVYTYSIWLKAPTPTFVALRMTQSCGANNAAIGVTAGTSWQRFALTETMGTPCSGGLLVRLNEYGPTSNTATLYVWGAQLEQAAQPGPFIPTYGAAATGTGAVATLTTTELPVGADSITVSYPGDAANQAGTGGPAIVQVSMASPALALTSSVNPSVSGTMVTFTATLSSGDSPSGIVTFLDGSTTLGIGTVSGGIATYATNSLSVGSHSITAAYGGDANNNSVTSSALSQIVNKGAPTVSISSSKNPATYGDSISFTASLPSNATGTITFLDGATAIGSAAISGGSATFTTSGLSVGTHPITASYAGDSNYNAGGSSILSQVVNKAPIALNVTSSLNPSHYDQSVILTIAASGAGAVPSGTVTVMDGGTSLGVLTLTPSGAAGITTSTLAAGTHTFTITYNGDGNYY